MYDAEKFPPEHKVCLDKDVMRELGLTKHRMVVKDAIFFCKLSLPICDVNSSGIFDDSRHNYFSDV